MAFVVADRVQETTTTTGTGSVTLLGAVSGFQTFAAIGNGNTTYYTIADQAGSNWEVGLGTYSTTGPTLARTTVLASSNSGALVNFTAGIKLVFCTYPAEEAVISNGTNLIGPTGIALSTANGGTGLTTVGAANTVLTSNGTTLSWQPGGVGTITTTDFTATAGQTTFTVSYTVGLVEVYRNGVKLAAADYTATSGTSIVLATGANAGDIVEVVAFSSLNIYSTITTDTFSGNGSTTAFTMSVTPANAASTLVAISGVVQDPSTYTVAGTTLTFSAAPPSGTNNISVRYLGVPSVSTVSSFSAGTTGLTPSTATSGAVTLAGTLAVANGGTGQTAFTSGQVHYGSFSTSSSFTYDGTNFSVASGAVSDSIGNVRTLVQNSQTGAYVLVATDNGKHISITTGGVTVPQSIFSAGQNVVIFNNSGSSQTITQGTGVTLYFGNDGTTGNRTLGARGLCTVLCVASNTFVITGAGLT